MKQHLDSYKAAVADRSAAYERTLLERSRIIRQTEKENLNTGRRRTRGMSCSPAHMSSCGLNRRYFYTDLNSFRQALSILQSQVDDLDRLKSEYYESVLTHEEQVWDSVLGKVSYSARMTMDVYDRITSKS